MRQAAAGGMRRVSEWEEGPGGGQTPRLPGPTLPWCSGYKTKQRAFNRRQGWQLARCSRLGEDSWRALQAGDGVSVKHE